MKIATKFLILFITKLLTKPLAICLFCLIGGASLAASPILAFGFGSGTDSALVSTSVFSSTSGLDSSSQKSSQKLSEKIAARIALDAHRIGVNKPAMLTLGAWAAGNVMINGLLMIGSSKQEDKTAFYFQQMNLFWGAVNLGLAASGYWSALAEQPANNTLFQSLEKQSGIKSILLLNAGLDVAYLAGAAWMLERARSVELGGSPQGVSTLESQRWRGFGQSLLVQGAFLLVFDVAVYLLHHLGGQPLVESAVQANALQSLEGALRVLQGVSFAASSTGGVDIRLAIRIP